jgi:acyl dehydratase
MVFLPFAAGAAVCCGYSNAKGRSGYKKTGKTMKTIHYRDIPALQAALEPDFTDWSNEVTVSQEMIDDFARLSGDDYWIHTDPERAARETPFGGTIAQGMLVQSLVGQLRMPLPFEVTGYRNMVNYGSDRLRFPNTVPAGSRIHARGRFTRARAVAAGTLLTLEIHIHVVGNDRPSVTNSVLILHM